MTDVFISYSRKDKAFVQRLFAALEAQHCDAWVDWDDIEYAEDWWQKIEHGIAGADNFVFIVSPHSARSKVCFDEVDYASRINKRIVPVIFADVDDPIDQERIHPALKRHNWLLFRPPDDFDSTFAVLLETIRREPEHVRMHTRLLVNAQEWAEADRNTSRLLRGDHLQQAARWLQASAAKTPLPTTLHGEYIAASRAAERTRRRSLAVVAVLGLIILAILSVAALGLLKQNRRAQAVQASLDLTESARAAYSQGRIFDALALAVQANALDDPPAESVDTLREIAGSPGPVALFEHDTPVSAVAFSPDGTRIFAGYADGSLRWWDAARGVGTYGDALQVLPEALSHAEQVNSVDISADGKYAASAGCAQVDPDSDEPDNPCIAPQVLLWEIREDQLLLRYRFDHTAADDGYERRVLGSNPYMVKFNPNPRDTETLVLGVAFGHAEGPVTLSFRFDDPSEIEPPFVRFWLGDGSHPREVVTALAFSPTGDDVLSGDINGGLRYWQGAGNDPAVVNGFDARITDIAISPDLAYSRGSRPFLAASTDGTLRKGLASNNDDPNPSTFRPGIDGTDGPYAINAVAYSPDGQVALSAVDNGTLVLFDMAAVQPIETLYVPGGAAVTAVDYGQRPDADRPYYAVAGTADGRLILWDTAYSDLADLPDAAALLDWLDRHRYVPAPAADSSDAGS